MIPKVFNWVWIGQAPIPEQDQQWMLSWLEHNPKWKGVVWTDQVELQLDPSLSVKPIPALVNQRFFDGIEEWVSGAAAIASKSDIVRYEIIARHGGVYLDTDVEAFAPLGSMLSGVELFYSDEWGPCGGNYMFGSSANHPTMWTVVRELGPHLSSQKALLNAVYATGPGYLAPKMRSHPGCVIFPHMLFNPLCAFDDPEQVKKWPAVSIANHHFSGKWYERTKNKPPTEFLEEN